MKKDRVLVISAHPDDETLGCSGTLLRHREFGDEIFWCIMTSMSEECGFQREQVLQRNEEIKAVAEAYGFQDKKELNYPTTRLDIVPMTELVGKLSNVLREVEPSILYLPFLGDIHSDHRVTCRAVLSCTKAFRHPYLKKILMMEILSETEFSPPIQSEVFVPNVYIDVTGTFEKKIEIMHIYRNEIGPHPFPRSKENLTALALHRGATAGCRYAESFMLVKEII